MVVIHPDDVAFLVIRDDRIREPLVYSDIFLVRV